MKLISKIIKFFGFKPKLKVFIYGYLRSPFDSEQKFYLDAIDEKEADKKAAKIMKCNFENGHVVLLNCWRTK